MNWAEVIAHPALRNLQFKIETNRLGQIVMSSTTNQRGLLQSAIATRIYQLKISGHVQFQCAVETEDGVKVADVAWYSAAFFQAHRYEMAYSAVPELCVEVQLRSNSTAELAEKARLYFQHGAHEVWICDEDGVMHFANQSGELPKSKLFPEFPGHVDIV